jgi:hypothetical protein
MEYILFIHNNVDHATTEEQWSRFYIVANESGMFNGGSEVAESHTIGDKPISQTTKSVVGIMRFETNDIDKLNNLLKLHPVYLQGGTLELCKMPQT